MPRLSENSLESSRMVNSIARKSVQHSELPMEESFSGEKEHEISHDEDDDVQKFFAGKREFPIFGSQVSLVDYCSNLVQTSKYNFITFLPMNLLVQFSKVANLYFLFQACL